MIYIIIHDNKASTVLRRACCEGVFSYASWLNRLKRCLDGNEQQTAHNAEQQTISAAAMAISRCAAVSAG